MRIDLYALVHKAQRYHLFEFARELGRADLEHGPTRAHIASSVRHISDMLLDHSHNEAQYVHPLFAALGRAADGLDDEHRELESSIEQLVSIVDQGRWSELYRAVMRLIGRYLLHMDAEENAQAEILWANYTDAELSAVMTRFKTERDPAASRADLKLLFPALTVAELASVLGRLHDAPEPVRREAFTLARELSGVERRAMVERILVEDETPERRSRDIDHG